MIWGVFPYFWKHPCIHQTFGDSNFTCITVSLFWSLLSFSMQNELPKKKGDPPVEANEGNRGHLFLRPVRVVEDSPKKMPLITFLLGIFFSLGAFPKLYPVYDWQAPVDTEKSPPFFLWCQNIHIQYTYNIYVLFIIHIEQVVHDLLRINSMAIPKSCLNLGGP